MDPVEEEDFPASETTPAEPVGSDTVSWLENLAASPGEIDLSGLADDMELDELEALDLELDEIDESIDTVSWLENLTQGQSEGGLVNLPGEAPVSDEATQPAPPINAGDKTDTMEWLESLAKRQGASEEELLTDASLDIPSPENVETDGPGYQEYSFEAEAAQDDPQLTDDFLDPIQTEETVVDPEDPAEWLESIASGSRSIDLHTVDSSTKAADAAPSDTAPSETAPSDAELSDEDIQTRLAAGEEIAPDDMKAWMERQLDRGLSSDEPDYVEDDLETVDEIDPDAPALKPDLPDWLIEQASQTVIEEQAAPPPEDDPIVKAFDDIDTSPSPVASDAPDWLLEDINEDDDITQNIEAIFDDDYQPEAILFEDDDEVEDIAESGDEIIIDTNDPWVEAFDMEQQQGEAAIEESSPEWYQDNINDPQRIAAVERLVSDNSDSAPAEATSLQDAALGEESALPAAQVDAVPDWVDETPTPSPAAASEMPQPQADSEASPGGSETVDTDMPDWLVEEAGGELTDHLPEWLVESGTDIEDLSDVPEWLMETIEPDEAEEPAEIIVEQPPAPPAVAQPAPPPQPAAASPAPIAAQLADIDAPAVLASARQKAQSADIDGCVLEYETLIRANKELSAVVEDLRPLVEAHKENPAVHRVLGDALMRQGNLQEALETYRSALNML